MKEDAFIWAYLIHLGMNNWKDIPLNRCPPEESEHFKTRCMADYLRTEESEWRFVTDRLGKIGANMIIIDLGEGMAFPSHPELAVRGTWSVEKMRAELKRLRGMGLEPIPKLNFSTCHDSWLKDYQRMVSTPEYYRVCADVIRDAVEIFDHPRFFHLGYDEETAGHQSTYELTIVRQGELWWHDLLWFVDQVSKLQVRPWIWSDFCWRHKEAFVKRMPRSVLQSNWYYGKEFDLAKIPADQPYVQTYVDLEKAGFDQIPTGSNWSCDTNFDDTIRFCREHCSPERLKGFLFASWQRTISPHHDKAAAALDQLEAAIKRG
ncbi:MAG: Tat pathway signal protein [Kiritimatiellae bacterium]|nr:Tat pathway signal protein [Kiritimatiellia bacterium]